MSMGGVICKSVDSKDQSKISVRQWGCRRKMCEVYSSSDQTHMALGLPLPGDKSFGSSRSGNSFLIVSDVTKRMFSERLTWKD